jgi:hypothetical protein
MLNCSKTTLDNIKMAPEFEEYSKDQSEEFDLTTLLIAKLYSIHKNEWNVGTDWYGRILKGESQSTRREIVLLSLCPLQISETPYAWRGIFVVENVAIAEVFLRVF